MSKLRISLVQDSPDQVHYPGSEVRGNLLLDVNKPKSYKQITIQFVGKSQVYLTGGRRSSQSGDKDKENSSKEVYIDLVTVVWNSTDHPDGKLTPGQHSWPFSFIIPQSVPSSYEGAFGNIRYTLEGKIVTGWSKSNHTVEAQVPVQQFIVYPATDSLLRPQHQEVTKRMGGCCTTRSIILRAAVPKTTFFTGESFVLNVSLENGSSRRLEMSVYVKQDVKFSAENGKIKWDGKTIATVANTEADPRSTRDWEPTIEMPSVDIVEERSCDIIKVTHSLTVNCKISRSENLFTVFPLKIGNYNPHQQMPPPPSNPQNLEPHHHVQLQSVPENQALPNPTFPSAPPPAPSPHTQQPYPPPNPPFHPVQMNINPRHSAGAILPQYPPQGSGHLPPQDQGGVFEYHLSDHTHLSRQASGGVPTPFAGGGGGVPVAISQWESTLSLQ